PSSSAWSPSAKTDCAAFLTEIRRSRKSSNILERKAFRMPKYSYVAMDAHGKETKGTLEVGNQNEAIGRVKEMGLFPTRIVEIEKVKEKADQKKAAKPGKKKGGGMNLNIKIPGLSGRVKS